MNNKTLERFADLITGFGANIQEGQTVTITCAPGKEYLVRALAEHAYKRGAKFVDVTWFDPWVKRARIKHARDETLDFVPSWYGDRMLALGEQHCARIALSGPTSPGLLADLDQTRAAHDRLPWLKESVPVLNARTTNWTIAPCPTLEWAQLVFPELEDEAALTKLEDFIMRVCRMDEADPIAVWKERIYLLESVAQRLTERNFDAIRYVGPGTDLMVGMLPSHIWTAARFETIDGIVHMPNVPTEEVFTTPDPTRTSGHVTSTRPLVLIDGTVVKGLQMSFESGQAVDVTAESGQETIQAIIAQGENSGRLGELALVDGDSRIGQLDTIFFDTLLDENAASHIALGSGFDFGVTDEADKAKVNESDIHIDFMIGSNDVSVFGITHAGESVPILRNGHWLI